MNTPTLQPKAAARLVAFCGMLGSDHAGERANAARFATKLLADNGLTWADLVKGRAPADLGATDMPQGVEPPPRDAGYRALCRWCFARPALLTPWETGFLDKLIGWKGQPSDLQFATLAGIVDELEAASGTARRRSAA